MNKRLIMYPGVILLIGVVSVVSYSQATKKSTYQFAPVVRGPMTQEVLASGDVESPSTVSLYFKQSGKLIARNVQIGNHVQAGDVLAQEDATALEAQLMQAQAQVDAQTALLHKLQSGPTQESVDVARAELDVATQSLANLYASVPATLSTAVAEAKDAAIIQLASFFSNADTDNSALTFITADSRVGVQLPTLRINVRNVIASWDSGSGGDQTALDAALASDSSSLATVAQLLTLAVQAVSVNTSLSATDVAAYRAAASLGLSEVNKAIASAQALQQSILTAKSALAKSQADLALAEAGATQNDLDAQEALVAQASSAKAAIEAQKRDLQIIAPIAGTVTDTNGEIGEIAQPGEAIVSVMPNQELEIKVNVSEDNIVGVSSGETARAQLDAIAGQDLPAQVISVDPAQTIIGGAVYYKTTLHFDTQDPRVRPGMTANVWIQTGAASSTLSVPASALEEKNGATYVEVKNGASVIEREVTTGLKDQQGRVEIIRGLTEGDNVVTGVQ